MQGHNKESCPKLKDGGHGVPVEENGQKEKVHADGKRDKAAVIERGDQREKAGLTSNKETFENKVRANYGGNQHGEKKEVENNKVKFGGNSHGEKKNGRYWCKKKCLT